MGGSKWTNVREGAKYLINFIKDHHSNLKEVYLVIAYFNDNAERVWYGNLDNPIPERIWKCDTKGGTEYGPILEMGI